MPKKKDEIESDESENFEYKGIDISLKQFKGKGFGIGDAAITKLQLAGMNTLYDVCIRGSGDIKNVAGVDEGKATDLIMQCYKILADNNLCTKSDLSIRELRESRKSMIKVATKCRAFDNMLKGGVETEAITEIYGEFGTGKTQFCMTVAAEAVGNGYNTYWIDCENTFNEDRFEEILTSRGIAKTPEELDKVYERIHIYRTQNTDMVVSKIESLGKIIREKQIRVLIIDGMVGKFRAEYLGRGTLAERQQALAKIMYQLQNIAFFYGVAIVFTNQVMEDPARFAPSGGDIMKPIGGHVVAHASSYRMYVRKNAEKADPKRVVRMMDSPKGDIVEEFFKLTEKGIEDL